MATQRTSEAVPNPESSSAANRVPGGDPVPSAESADGRPLATVGALIEDPQGRILLVRTHKWRGRLGLPGGKIERGESQEQALRRELREETGLEVRDIRFLLVQDCIDSPEFHRPVHMLLLNYHCKTDGTEVHLNDEAEVHLWTTPEDALGLDLNGPTRTLISRLLKDRGP